MASKRPSVDDSEDGRAQKRSFAAWDNIVTVTVGPEKVRHLVHESVLCKSPFFNKCLHSGMREQEETAVHLPEDDPAGFAIIVEWLYADKIAENLDWGCMLRAYNAARRFGMSDLQNALVDELRAQFALWGLKPEVVSYFWKNTIEGCPLRKLVLDLFYHQVLKEPAAYKKAANAHAAEENGMFASGMEQLMANAQLVTELFWRFADPADRPPRGALKTKGCLYHVHEDGKGCYLT